MRPTTGVASAVVGWLLVDGFVEHRYGVLGFDVARDLAVLALLIFLVLVATSATSVNRAKRATRAPQ
jgi:hypothetical protein